MTSKYHSRRMLLLIALCFATPMLAAWVLNQIGWMPSGRRNYGELLAKPIMLSNTSLIDGAEFLWKTPDWHWTLLTRIPGTCIAACRAQLDLVPNLRQALDRHAVKLRITIVDAMPEGSTLNQRTGIYLLDSSLADPIDIVVPRPQAGIQMALVDPNGYVVLRYPEHADFSRIRKDLVKLVK